MIIQFLYTETDAPGPFKVEGGYKFKVALVPSEFGGVAGESVPQALEPELNRVLPHFTSYKAPEVGVFMSADEFAKLPRDHVFISTTGKSYGFGLLGTCGVNHGRPGTPFHQGFVFEEDDYKELLRVINQKSPEVRPRPVDLAFVSGWLTARGEIEVNAATFGSDSFPFVTFRQADLSQIHHQAFDSSSNPLAIVRHFGQALFDSTDMRLPMDSKTFFSQWVSLLTHLVPQSTSWRMFYSSLDAFAQRSEPGIPTFSLGESLSQGKVSPEVEIWSRVIHRVYSSGLDTDFLPLLERVIRFFAFPVMNDVPSHKNRPLLTMALLAFLFMEEALFDESEPELADDALDALISLGLPRRYRSAETKSEVQAILNSGDRLLHQTVQWEQVLEVLDALELSDSSPAGGN
jgi:hypothetical protein